MKLLITLLLLASTATAQTCPERIKLKVVDPNGRGGNIIYKSNWNKEENREQTIEEGNHSQKGAALLIYYKAKKYIPATRTIEVRDTNCKVLARFGRYPRCTSAGCGEHERWYLRAPRGSYLSVAQLAERASISSGNTSVLIRLKGRLWAQVTDVYSNREIAK